MKPFRSLISAAVASAMSPSATLAHGGHALPAGVAETGHLHLAQGVIVPGSVMLGLLLAGVVLGAIVWRRRTANTGEAGRGGQRRNA